MENGEGNGHSQGRHALKDEPKTDVIPVVDAELAEKMRRKRIRQLAVGIPTAIALTLGGALAIDLALKPDRPTYGEVLPAPPNLTDQEKRENGAMVQGIADRVVHTLTPAPDEPEDDGTLSLRQRLQQSMDRSTFVNDEGGESEAGIVRTRDERSGSITTYHFVVNHAPDSDRVASVEWGAEATIPGSDSDIPAEEAIVRQVSTKIIIGPDGVYTITQQSNQDAIVGPKGHEYGVHKMRNVTATTEDVPPEDLLVRRPLRHIDAFATNANLDALLIGAANGDPFKFPPDQGGHVAILLANTPSGEPVRMPG